MKNSKTYAVIDLKSFYASVECVERKLDPLTTNLLVADGERTEKTICLAVSPSLKAYGISGRARLFEANQRLKEVNEERRKLAPNKQLIGSSYNDLELKENKSLAVDYIMATPRMAYYMKYSAEIYNVYLKYVAPEDIHVYSIDEVFIDLTAYLNIRKQNAHDFVRTMIKDVLKTTGITATAGIGTNMYLAKVALDIVAKKVKPDKDGVRIASLNEQSYRELLWDHKPLTDFWRVGKGISAKLEEHGMYTMGDVALCSVADSKCYRNEDLLYKLFGINAELLIDHAWGYEPCTIEDVKSYKPVAKSITSGQVLHEPYTAAKARLIVHEMIDLLVLDLVEKGIVTNQITLTVGYDIENLKDPKISASYFGEVTKDHYGRLVPKHAHGTVNFKKMTSSTEEITKGVLALYDKIINKLLLVRRINICANHIEYESNIKDQIVFEQLDIFNVNNQLTKEEELKQKEKLQKEKELQKTVVSLKKRFGKNAILKGMNLEEGATSIDRNKQIGGHRA